MLSNKPNLQDIDFDNHVSGGSYTECGINFLVTLIVAIV